MQIRVHLFQVLAVVALLAAPAAQAVQILGPQTITITVTARRAYRNVVVVTDLAPERHSDLRSGEALVLVSARGERIPCQLMRSKTSAVLTFVIAEMAQGESREYELRKAGSHDRAFARESVRAVKEGQDVAIFVGKSLFTRYTTRSGPNKPFFYPILTPDGRNITRRWPVEDIASDSHDHIHHRGLWFTHGSVNGADFWSEGKKTGKTVANGYPIVEGGRVYGGFDAATDWIMPDGKRIGSDSRSVRVYALPNGDRLMDFRVTFRAAGAPVIFGDTKEGMFGLRVADSLAPAHGGHSINARGDLDAAVWSKQATWVDYWGQLEGSTYGVAIFDDSKNLRFPETWHARDYGLFAVNPFGLHDFMNAAPGAGDYTVPADGALVFRYRLLFHTGDVTTADVADQYNAFAFPPEVSVVW